MLGLAQLGPMLVFGLVGGAFADGHDKRRVLLGVSVIAMACSVASGHQRPPRTPPALVMYALGAVAGATFAVTFSRRAFATAALLDVELRPAAFALQSTYGSFGMMAGPAIAGLVIGGLGITSAYTIDVVTYGLALVAFAGIAPSPPVEGAGTASRSSVIEGLRFLRGHSVVMSVFSIDLIAMVFGMPRALFPGWRNGWAGDRVSTDCCWRQWPRERFSPRWRADGRRASRTTGAPCSSASPCGGDDRRRGAHDDPPCSCLVMFLCAGGADMISGVYRSTIAADVTPDDLRGRVSGVELAVYAGGPSSATSRPASSEDCSACRSPSSRAASPVSSALASSPFASELREVRQRRR